MLYRYVCSVKSFPNCRVHDSGFESGLRFFKDIDEAKRELAETYETSEYGDLYFTGTGVKVARVTYEFQRHEFRKLEINRTQEHLESDSDFEGCILMDNGYGKKEWMSWEQKRNARA